MRRTPGLQGQPLDEEPAGAGVAGTAPGAAGSAATRSSTWRIAAARRRAVDGGGGRSLAGAWAILLDHWSGLSAAADLGDVPAVDGQHVAVGACAEGEHSRDHHDGG